MLTLRPKFLLAAAFLTTTAAQLSAASFFPTSPLIQIGQDTDIFFTANAALNITDNLYSSTTKTSATSYTVTPGFALEYAKDSPLYATASISRSLVRYAGISKLNNSQDVLDGAVFIDLGGPLKFTLHSNYRESARNDNLTSLGIDGNAIGETLVRQGDYQHSLKLDYRLTEKISIGATFTNSYNRYLNPVTIVDPADTNPIVADRNRIYNTNSLNEINTKNIVLTATYNPPGDLITYGLNYSHALNDFSPAPYLSTNNVPHTQDIYKSTQDNLSFTASGSLTRSGKLGLSGSLGAVSSTTFSRVAAESKSTGLSYNLSLKHQLTESLNHSIDLGRSVSPTPSGINSKTTTYSYSISCAAAEKATFSFNVSRADTTVGETKIVSLNYGAMATYQMNQHLNFTANLSLADTKFPANSATNFQAKGFILSADFRY